MGWLLIFVGEGIAILKLFLCVVVWNFIVFILFGIDKFKAKRSHWRIPERTLLLCAFFVGSLGALFGMYIFHHKTLHNKFRIGIPVMFVMHIFCLAAFVFLTFIN